VIRIKSWTGPSQYITVPAWHSH